METTLPKPTAYQKWLFNESKGHPVALANLIVQEVLSHNLSAFDILEMTGDKQYDGNTMIKAAKILCDICGEWTPDYKIMPLEPLKNTAQDFDNDPPIMGGDPYQLHN
jgi:hypothetical protein